MHSPCLAASDVISFILYALPFLHSVTSRCHSFFASPYSETVYIDHNMWSQGECQTFVCVIDLDLAFAAAFPLLPCRFAALFLRAGWKPSFLILIAISRRIFYSLIRAHLLAHFPYFLARFLRLIFSLFSGIRIWLSEETSRTV